MFDRCHRSWAAETPDKYQRDWMYLTYTFATIKISRNGEIKERISSNPHPRSYQVHRVTILVIGTETIYNFVSKDKPAGGNKMLFSTH